MGIKLRGNIEEGCVCEELEIKQNAEVDRDGRIGIKKESREQKKRRYVSKNRLGIKKVGLKKRVPMH